MANNISICCVTKKTFIDDTLPKLKCIGCHKRLFDPDIMDIRIGIFSVVVKRENNITGFINFLCAPADILIN